jgi:hypothetical protein
MSAATAITNETLLAEVKQIQALLSHCDQALSSPLPSLDSPLPAEDAPNPLQALRDAAKLLHAHGTKIGLLIINEPFTPSAIQKELAACEGQCIPGMMGAVEACHPATWTAVVAKEARLRAEASFGGLGLLLLDVKRKAEGGVVKLDATKQKEKTLASTGQVWQACDALIALEKSGIAGCVAKKAQEYREMLKDAIEELKEWGEDEDDQDEGFVGSGDEADDDDIEDMFSGARLPAHRKDLRELLEEALKKLKLVDMLFQALLKRRLKTFDVHTPPSTAEEKIQVRRIGDLATSLKTISESVDEFAHALYELDVEQARIQLDRILNNATDTAVSMQKSWVGDTDEFTTWSSKWREAITKQPVQKGKDEA